MKAMRALGLSIFSVSVSVLAMATPVLASWEDVASPYDVKRLSRLDEARARGADAARSGSIERDSAAVQSALAGSVHRLSRGEIVGNWRCRTAKAGGILPPVGYSWFHCRVSERDGHLFFQKLNGSQRVAGWLYPHESGGFVLLGAWSVKGEPMHMYSGNGVSAGARSSPDDAVALVSSAGSGRVRLEFPFPGEESVYDVMEMRR